MRELQKTDVYDTNPELIERYREGDEAAGDRLVEINLPLVYSIASRFRERCDDMSDLVECGTIGLVKAFKTFDLSRGCAFSTYAVPLIFGEIRRFLRDDGIIKVSREQKRLSAILNKERERRLSAGERCDIVSIAEAVGVTPQDAASALFSELPVRSLDESPTGEDDGVTLGALIADEESVPLCDRLALRVAIEGLSPFHRRIVALRYFRDLSQTEVARLLGVSQVKISREEKKIIAALKAALSD